MKTFKYTFLIVALVTISVSCRKKFLDVEDKSVLLRQQYVKDLSTLGEFLNGVYIFLGQDFFDASNQLYPEVVADNIKPRADGYMLRLAYSWELESTNSDNMVAYNYNYAITKACNFVIEKADEFRQANSTVADNLKAQALAVRALVNFYTVNIYAQSYNFSADGAHAGIALPVTSDPFEKVTKRSSVAEVYSSVIHDLNTAIPLFSSDDISNTLVLNRIAARGLLARVLLFTQDYNSAKNLALDVISKVPLMSVPEYPEKLFTREETEALFQLAPADNYVDPRAYTTNFQGGYLRGEDYEVLFSATESIANILTEDDDDVRKSWVTNDNGEWKIMKYPVDLIPGFYPVSKSYYPTVLRSSEMFLIVSEACARLGKDDSAKIYLNEIRLRANPAATPVTSTGNDLLQSVYKERRKELAFEGYRMFDLLRWKNGVDRGADATPGSPASLPYPADKAIAPIPLPDVNISGLQQNPGY